MSATPMIDDILATHEQGFVFRNGFDMGRLATELRTLLAERDALTPAPVERRLRAVKLSDGLHHRWNNGVLEFQSRHSGDWIEVGAIRVADIDAVNSLIASPEEPVETVEDVLSELCLTTRRRYPDDYAGWADRLRAAVRAEAPNAWASHG